MNRMEPIFFTPRPRPWDTRRHKGGGSSAPAADPLIGQAAMKQAEIAEDALGWYRDIYEKETPQREAEYATQQKVAEEGLKTQQTQNKIAADWQKEYEEVFRPLTRGIVADAQAYDTPERREQQAGEAIADVNSAFDAAGALRRREMEGFGIAPGQGRYNDDVLKEGIGRASAAAGAGTPARRNVELQGYARKMDAASLGLGVPGSQATATQVALQAGGAASGATATGGAGRRADTGTMGQGYGIAIGGWQGAGNTALAGYRSQLDGWNADQSRRAQSSAGIGRFVGTVAGAGIGYAAGGPVGMAYGASAGSRMF
jgi:hypothetical protein